MAVVLTAALTFPVPMAHTVTELDAWSADWNARAMHSLDVEMMNERREIRANHQWFFDPQPEEVHHRNHTSGDVTAPPPGNTGMGSDVEQWRGLVAAYTGWDVDHMLRIMACESGGNPNAYNGTTGVAGLFQIHPLWQKVWPGDYYDPAVNVAVAYQVWLEQGYRAWVCKG